MKQNKTFIQNAVIYDGDWAEEKAEKFKVIANILVKELTAITGKEYSVKAGPVLEGSVKYSQCVQLGANPSGKSFQDVSLGEHYLVEGDEEIIYIDGNCPRAIVYGGYDMLRYYGCEYYTADLTVRPSKSVTLGKIRLESSADFGIRQYVAADTAFVDADQASEELQTRRKEFSLATKVNNGGYIRNYGMNVAVKSYGDPSHNFDVYFNDHTEGKYGMTVETGAGNAPKAFAPCLTNGITHNVDGEDTTLTYAVARMKALMLANPEAVYFGFGQNDGPRWHCHCEHCLASNEEHGGSGTLIRFINKMIEKLRADKEIGDRPFTIITLTYGFTMEAPKTDITLNESLCCQYAPLTPKSYLDYKYSIDDERQRESAKQMMDAWIPAIGKGKMSLYLYDTSYNNYLSYFPSTTINGALDGTLRAAKKRNVGNLFILGAYAGNNNAWQTAMKAYIWGKKMWDISQSTAALQDDFVNVYFGPAAEKVKEYMSVYDAAYAALPDFVVHGSGYINSLPLEKHIECLQIALDGVERVKKATDISEKKRQTYLRHANAVLASSYGTIIYNYDKYYTETCAEGTASYAYRSKYLGAAKDADEVAVAKEGFIAKLKAAVAAANILRVSEAHKSVEDWLESYVAKGWT